MREIKFLGCLFSKRHERCEAPYIYPVNFKKLKCMGGDFDLILFCDKVVLGLSFSVCTEDEQKIAFGNFEEAFKREARCLSLKNLSPAKGISPFGNPAKGLFIHIIEFESASLSTVLIIKQKQLTLSQNKTR